MANPFAKPIVTRKWSGQDPQAIASCAEALRAGELVAFPTETVYGLGADATQAAAVAAVYAAKGRPSDHPLIVHVAPEVDLSPWVHLDERAERLIAAFWPGPLTLVLPCRDTRLNAVTGGQSTLAVRSPAHPVALALLREFVAKGGSGLIAAPSANPFGAISPTTATHVIQGLQGKVHAVLDGGACPVGLESTIIDLSTPQLRLLRPGMIDAEAIAAAVELTVTPGDAQAPRVSGSLPSHYAPRTPTRLIPRNSVGLMRLASLTGRRIFVLALDASFFRKMLSQNQREFQIHTMPAEPKAYAQALYATLHEADAGGHDLILIEQPPQTAEWTAINDRIVRAAGR